MFYFLLIWNRDPEGLLYPDPIIHEYLFKTEDEAEHYAVNVSHGDGDFTVKKVYLPPRS